MSAWGRGGVAASARGSATAIDALIAFSVAGVARRRATSAHAERLCESIDWSQLASSLRRRRLLTLLGPRLAPLARAHANRAETPGPHAGEDFAEQVEQALAAERRRGALLQMIAHALGSRLGRAGIASAQLKGPALSEALYGDPGRRASRDLDLLVPRERLVEAIAIAVGMGYEPSPSSAPAARRSGLAAEPLLHHSLTHRRLPPLELHWRVHWYEQSFAGERLLPGAGAARFEAAWRPAPADELVALLLFYARDGFMSPRHAADVGAWWDAYGDRLPAQALDETLDAYPALARVVCASLRVAETELGVPVHELTARADRLGARARVAVRLAGARPLSSEAQIHAEIGLIDGLLAPRRDLHNFVRRQVLPPRGMLRDRALDAGASRASTLVGHCVRTLGRYALSLARTLGANQVARGRRARSLRVGARVLRGQGAR